MILLFTVILFIFLKKVRFEGFDNNFHIYVITLKSQDRINNINHQQKKIDIPIKIFDAVNGNDLNLKDYNIEDSNFDKNEGHRKRQVGCYLSHYNIYKQCKKSGYSIVFEDDFSIDVNDLIGKINSSIEKIKNQKMDFDIMFLGNHLNNNIHGELIIDDLYKIGNNENLEGTQAYVINNKNIDKIIEHTTYIEYPIDVQIQKMADNKKLNVFKTYPYYVNVIDTPSTIVPSKIGKFLYNY